MKSRILPARGVVCALAAGALLSMTNAATLTSMPKKLQLYPRTLPTDSGTVTIAGTSTASASVKIYRNGTLVNTFNGTSGAFSIACKIKAELASYKFEVYDGTTLSASADSVVCGDAFIVNGQSNSSIGLPECSVNRSPWIRTLGSPSNLQECSNSNNTEMNWHYGTGVEQYALGGICAWGSRLAKAIVDSQKIPVAFFNGASSGMQIAYFQKTAQEDQCTNLQNNYKRLLNRINAAGLAGSIRAVFWHQGESDAAPGIELTTDQYKNAFKTLRASWLLDYQAALRVYLYQIGPRQDTDATDLEPRYRIREAQRQMPDFLPIVATMSASAQKMADDAHYGYVNGYDAFGNNMYRLVARDLYNGTVLDNIDPPNVQSAVKTGPTEITLTMRNSTDKLTWQGNVKSFVLEGTTIKVTNATVSGNTVKLTLSGSPTDATGISYTGYGNIYDTGDGWAYGPDPMVVNARGAGALHFYNFPFGPATTTSQLTVAKSRTDQVRLRATLTLISAAGLNPGMSNRNGMLVAPDGRLTRTSGMENAAPHFGVYIVK